MQSVYTQENISTEWRDSLRGLQRDKADIGTLKIWEMIIERKLRDAHFGVMPGRGMADAIFAVRQRMEKKGRRTIKCLVNNSGRAIGRRDCQIVL